LFDIQNNLASGSKVERAAGRAMRTFGLRQMPWLVATCTELDLEGSDSSFGMSRTGQSDKVEVAAASTNAGCLALCYYCDGI